MSKAKVLIFAPADESGETHRQLRDAGCELSLGDASWHTPQGNSEPELVAMAAGADALTGTSIRSTPISKAVLKASKRLRIVSKYTIGVDDVDVDAATELGILVTHAPTESNWGGVAEGVVAQLLTLLKKTRERDSYLKAGGKWRDPTLNGTYLGARSSDGYPGITLGLVGLGRVGGRVANLLSPWNMRILACDPYIPAARFEEHGVTRVDLAHLLAESDVVSLHVTLTAETRHLMDAARLAQMKPGAVLINTSRGGAVDEAALVAALEQARLAAAALDVFENEPLALDSPLRKMGDKVLLSAHMISSNAGSGLKPGIAWGTRSVLAALRGEVPDNVYNKEVIPVWESRFGGQDLLS